MLHGLSRRLLPPLLLLCLPFGCQCEDEIAAQDPGSLFEMNTLGEYVPVYLPRLEGPEVVDFGIVSSGQVVRQTVTLQNVSRAQVVVTSWRVNPENFRVEMEEGARAIEPGQSLQVPLSYQAIDATRTGGKLVFETNVPEQTTLAVELTSTWSGPCLRLDPEGELDFGSVPPAGKVTKPVRILNCSSDTDLQVGITLDNFSSFADTGFSFASGGGDAEFELEAGESTVVELRFVSSPREEAKSTDTFRVTYTPSLDAGPRQEASLALVARVGQDPCPLAVIKAASIDAPALVTTANPQATYKGLPLDELEFQGGGSTSPVGRQIARYEWSLVSKPRDSGARMRRKPEEVNNALFLDLTGTYVVELTVWDSAGVKSCQPARLELQATPNEDIHVQLVWDTPSDKDQFDEVGSDVDLHLMRQEGQWNHPGDDCHWQSKTLDWGRPNDPSDDPSLDIDDLNGWGPENINLDDPTPGTRYHVGVEYFSHEGFGTSLVTVRLYIKGELVSEHVRQPMENQEFWHVLDLLWPTQTLEVFERLYPRTPKGKFRP